MAESERIGIEGVTAPPASTTTTPSGDLFFQDEIGKARAIADLTPTQKHQLAQNQQVQRLERECDEHREECRFLRNELSLLRPKYDELREAMRHLKSNASHGAAMTVIGGGALSAASLFAEVAAKWSLFGAGSIGLLYGLSVVGKSARGAVPPSQRDGWPK